MCQLGWEVMMAGSVFVRIHSQDLYRLLEDKSVLLPRKHVPCPLPSTSGEELGCRAGRHGLNSNGTLLFNYYVRSCDFPRGSFCLKKFAYFRASVKATIRRHASSSLGASGVITILTKFDAPKQEPGRTYTDSLAYNFLVKSMSSVTQRAAQSSSNIIYIAP
mmetsp:Transcript_1121/g.2362  ORF Transcript_1121/g.2362 Transcript_1121/m.2362 type:complete len:162 (+) Transcript_1121:552-1037(+)